jgi:hypothetical protein
VANATIHTQTGEYNSTGGFNIELIFGDFTKALSTFVNLATGAFVVSTLTNIGFPSTFVIPFQVILGFFGLISLAYLISGRQ